MRGQCTTDRGKEEGECNVAACEGNREEVQTQTIFGDRLKRSILRTVECRDDRRVAENEQGIPFLSIITNVFCPSIRERAGDYQNLTEGLLEEKIPYEVAIQALTVIAEGKMFEEWEDRY